MQLVNIAHEHREIHVIGQRRWVRWPYCACAVAPSVERNTDQLHESLSVLMRNTDQLHESLSVYLTTGSHIAPYGGNMATDKH